MENQGIQVPPQPASAEPTQQSQPSQTPSVVNTPPKPPTLPLQSAIKPPITPITVSAKPKQLSTRSADVTKTHVSTLAIGARGPRLHGIDPSLPEHQETINKSLVDYVVVQEMTPGSSYNFRVFCRECGWQTHCHVKDKGIAMVRDHAVRHLYAV